MFHAGGPEFRLMVADSQLARDQLNHALRCRPPLSRTPLLDRALIRLSATARAQLRCCASWSSGAGDTV